MKRVDVHLRPVEGKGHSPGIDLELDEAEYERLKADYATYESGALKAHGSVDRSYRCHSVTLHLDEVENLVDGEAFPPDRTFLE
ncbi:MAG: hypothetical protein Q8Q12_20610 [bacterium]|nr:hypothetical protein [bacterium]